MAFLQSFVSQQLLFLFSKHLDTMSNATDCGTGLTDLCNKWKVFELRHLKQRSVWPETQSVESTLYPDVLKIKTIIVVKQNFAKMPFVYFLKINKSMIWTPWCQAAE